MSESQVKRLLSRWRSDPAVGANIVEWHTIPARQARLVPLPHRLHPGLREALHARGIDSLYLHQSEAWEHAASGENLVVVTGTASGKTLCYNLPVLHTLLQSSEARALYLFPTKALAQDQLTGAAALAREAAQHAGLQKPPGISPYDGDTPAHARPQIRQEARLIFSNPDMLHTGILPHHTSWAEFFSNLRFVVIDEIHTYRGVFGSHVANVIRRLKRVAAHYGSRPQFILTSATIANPVQLAGWLTEEIVTLIDEDGSARGEKHFLVYNPPVVDCELGIRRSLLQESVSLAQDLVTYDIQTILFGRSRRSVEVMLRYMREGVGDRGNSGDRGARDRASEDANGRNMGVQRPSVDPLSLIPYSPNTVRGYRSGYLPRQRREIERGLRTGEVRSVVATTALELGIDIGGMGAAVLAGYPGTIAGSWQQAGRAGRGSEASISVLVTSASPLDQFLAKHPEYFFGRSPEAALINPDNLLILLGHLRCAAFELPFREGERFGTVPADLLRDLMEMLMGEGILHHSGTRYFWMADRYPAVGVSLRSASADNVVLQVDGSESTATLGQVDIPSAVWMVHPGAVYLHEAQTFLVDALDLEGKIARLRPADVDYYTEPKSETTVSLVELKKEEKAPGCAKFEGEILVTTQVTGYRKVRWYTHENLGYGDLTLPPSDLLTTGYWVRLDDEIVEKLKSEGLWRNSPNDYGPYWPQIRDRVRQRDGYRCQLCGTPEAGRQHDVHHKTPFRSFTSVEEANQLSNLVTLCPACHKRVEEAVRIRSGLGGLSFVLSNLAPLFLMCDARDLGVHSDPQSPLVEGKPAVVIYDQAPGGIGFSERLFEMHSDLMQQARDLVAACECYDGCPSCVGPGGENGMGGKRETLGILEMLASDR